MSRTSAQRPLILNTGRVRDQWHTMTRTGKTPRLTSHLAEPFVEINPADADRLGLRPATLAVVASDHGEALLRVLITDRQRVGSVFAPIHWTDQQAAKARVDALVAAHVDPLSGQPEAKFTPVSVAPFAAAWYGFAVSANRPAVGETEYWALAPALGGFRLELAGHEVPADWGDWVRRLMGLSETVEVLAYHDEAHGRYRFAAFEGESLVGALFVSPEPVEISRGWVVGQLGATIDAAARFRILAGRGGEAGADPGATICSCFSVGINQITAVIRGGQATSVEAVGACLKAGTNCGSCRMEIGRLIDAHAVAKAG
ncbi:molybdopterin dinucleotide binding domain-containing protein [Oleomonas cavernae]|uniref:molybdopterin dinucleotide binding domain-containing protein n=1 Tax=Oleomonas cavernae TaxID=2320859 RepID=UPI0026A85864